MAQITHAAFRELLSGFGGCGLLFSEMCAAQSVPHGNGRNPLGFMWRPEELPPLVCQIFGNGDVFDERDCERMLRSTGCDGVALGRLAIARPRMFAAWTQGLPHGPHIYRDTALALTGLLPKYFDAIAAHRRILCFASYFAANFRSLLR
jgi:tRNA-dihydrouridine synthase